jgi:cysteine desulfurase
VLKSYEQLLEKYYVNSESLYDEGSEISQMMEKARGAIAGLLGVHAMISCSPAVLRNPTVQRSRDALLPRKGRSISSRPMWSIVRS